MVQIFKKVKFMKRKIIDYSNIEKVLKPLKKRGKKIVHCHGVFDLLHIGHIKHFNEAKNLFSYKNNAKHLFSSKNDANKLFPFKKLFKN